MRRILAVFCAVICAFPARADHSAWGLFNLCTIGDQPDASQAAKAMKLVCKGKVEGFIDGYRYTADRTRALPGAKRCYPENDDVDLIVVLLTGYLTQHPEDKKAPYPEVLKGVIDALYQCKTS